LKKISLKNAETDDSRLSASGGTNELPTNRRSLKQESEKRQLRKIAECVILFQKVIIKYNQVKQNAIKRV